MTRGTVLLFALLLPIGAFSENKPSPPDLGFLTAQLMGEDRVAEREKIRSSIRKEFAKACETGTKKELETRLDWFRSLPEKERDELAPAVVASLLKWDLRYRLEDFLKTPVPEKDRPTVPLTEAEFEKTWEKPGTDGLSLPLEPGPIFNRLFEAGIGGDAKARAEALRLPNRWDRLYKFALHSDFLFCKGVIRCHQALDKKDYQTLVAQMEWTWTYTGPETDGAATGRDWSRLGAILYWDVARHVGFEPELYLTTNGYTYGLPPGAIECGGERTLLSTLGKEGIPGLGAGGLGALTQMLKRVPGHDPDPSRAQIRRPLEVSKEVLKRCYDGALLSLQTATDKYTAEQSMLILAAHPEKAYHDDIRPFLQSPHPEISEAASRILKENPIQYPADYLAPQIEFKVHGKPLIQENVWVRHGRVGVGTATATTRTTDDRGMISLKRWDRTFLKPDGCVITFAPGPLRPEMLETAPGRLFGANLPLAELLEIRAIDFQIRPVQLRLSIPESRRTDFRTSPPVARVTLFAGQEDHGLGSSPDHHHSFPLDLSTEEIAFPDLPIGKHLFYLTGSGCFPISKIIEVTAEEPCVIEAQFRPSHSINVRFLDKDGIEVTRRGSAHILFLTSEDGTKTTRHLRESGPLDLLTPGHYQIVLRGYDRKMGEPMKFVIRETDPAMSKDVIEFTVPGK